MVTNRSAAPGLVVPTLVYQDVGVAIDWLCDTFGFEERFRYGPEGNPAGAQLAVGAGSIFLTKPRLGQSSDWNNRAVFRPPHSEEVTHTVSVHVEDVDHHYAHVNQCGASILHPPETYPYGERQYTVEDLCGHRWTFTQSVADVAPQEWGGKPANRLDIRSS
jgi:uncharacterized glyoxalase superfamily protein PhnB